jgi:glyoxalase family protein
MTMTPHGLHHLTAVTASAGANHAFYAGLLGMRLVKKSVNQDDVGAYHLFYGDGVGSPGSDVTFFEWPVPRERRGTGSVVRTALRVAGEAALDWWAARFAERGVAHGAVALRDGRATLDFEDPEGQRLALVDDGGAGAGHPWSGTDVPAEHQIRGLGPVRLAVPDLRPTDAVLTGILGLTRARDFEEAGRQVHVYAMGAGGPAAELHVAVEPGAAAGPGAGGVHHVAFRVPDAAYEEWAARLKSLRVPNSGPVDRYYFRSLYFREPNGILFELATDGPGFDADEPVERLGQRLALPPFLEPRRAEIEAGLTPL